MPDFSIGRLRGGFCVYWTGEDGQRRRYQLQARTRKEAEAEGLSLYRAKISIGKRGRTVTDFWEDYRQDAKKREALSQIQNLVKSHGLNFDEVTQSVRITAKRRKAPALYRNPANPRQTWSGKGEAPDWFRDAPNPEALRIQG